MTDFFLSFYVSFDLDVESTLPLPSGLYRLPLLNLFWDSLKNVIEENTLSVRECGCFQCAIFRYTDGKMWGKKKRKTNVCEDSGWIALKGGSYAMIRYFEVEDF